MPSFRRTPSSETLPDGLYEDVLSVALENAIDGIGDATIGRERLEARSADHLVATVAQALRIALKSRTGEHAVEEQLTLVNDLLATILARSPDTFAANEMRLKPELLLHVLRKHALGPAITPKRPDTPLTTSELFVNAERHGLLQELVKEIDSADRIDLICAFIRWSGFVKFRDALAQHCLRGRKLRVLTTTYLGATEARAISELVRLGAEVRISYEETPTRLHAKAWLFQRESGLTTGYVGSSNLSRRALTDGIEWNVRVSAAETPHVLEKFEAVFRSYWEDPASGFVAFRGTEEDEARLRDAIRRARRSRSPEDDPGEVYRLLDVEPHDFQRQILEDLDVARRVRGQTRNLVVAATGTGKTIVAALDYRRLRPDVRTLLFIAHREQILRRSLDTFRAVLREPTFGELYVRGERPVAGQQVFASIQSLAASATRALPAPDSFDMVIVDEVHHAAADTYSSLLRHLRPKILLGLTATPERSDDQPGQRLQLDEFFDRPWASELRLWEAIDRQILVPFNYFGIDDGTDVRGAWRKGRYVPSELSAYYTNERVWVRRVADAVKRCVLDPRRMRAIAFCVDITHARLVADELSRELGVRCVALTSQDAFEDRDKVLAEFERGDENAPKVICTVDLFNEGVDLPRVDTLLLLRPTESATLFLQQIGRGLRRADGKDCLTVLDFVGIQHERFRFDLRYSSLLGIRRGDLRDALEDGFDRLPAGCLVQLEEKPRRQILESLKRSLRLDLDGLAARLAPEDEAISLDGFLAREAISPYDLYRAGRTWTEVRERARLSTPAVDEDERPVLAEIQRLVHVDDPWRIELLRAIGRGLETRLTTERDVRLARLLLVGLFDLKDAADAPALLQRIRRHARLREEIAQLAEFLTRSSRVVPRPASTRLPAEVPLHLHSRYTTDEIVAAFDIRNRDRQLYRPQAGRIPVGSFDLILITLDKSGKKKLPHLQYEDYAISESLFHWQSQAGTTRASTAGRRHLDPAVTTVLFVRELDQDERGLAHPYRFLGVMQPVESEGERPMNITSRLLDTTLPTDLLTTTRAVIA